MAVLPWRLSGWTGFVRWAFSPVCTLRWGIPVMKAVLPVPAFGSLRLELYPILPSKSIVRPGPGPPAGKRTVFIAGKRGYFHYFP